MTVHFLYSCRSDCWNFYDTYGYSHCVGCQCCSKDKLTRYQARLRCCKRWLREELAFDGWDDAEQTRRVQEQNRKANIRFLKRRIRYYRNKLIRLNAKEECL